MATALGVPLGTLAGGALGWRAAFVAVAALGTVATVGLVILLRPIPASPAADLRARLAIARAPGVPTGLALTVLWIAGAFTVLIYINPVLDGLGGIQGPALSIWLLVFGVAAVAGNTLGGRAVDRYHATRPAVISTAGLAVALAGFGALASLGVGGTAGAAACAVILAVWGVFGWSFLPIQQARLVDLTPEHAGIVLSLNASATHLGISLGGLAGSVALSSGGITAVGWAAAAIELCAVLAASAIARPRRPRTHHPAVHPTTTAADQGDTRFHAHDGDAPRV
ncbi:MFS transporter [Nonomuraea antimicrobica]